MTERKDIIEGSSVTNATRYGLVYTCKCGWIDLGHANPFSSDSETGAANLWAAISREKGERSPNGLWHKVVYKQEMAKKIAGARFGDGVAKTFAVRIGLSQKDKESVALSILLNISVEFEQLQGKYGLSSSFSSEDLPSNIVGLYWAITGTSPIPSCQPVSKAAAERIWDTYGGPTRSMYKVRNIRPGELPSIMLFPCSDCKDGPASMHYTQLPVFLSRIKSVSLDANSLRLWNDSDPELSMVAELKHASQFKNTQFTAAPVREVTVARGDTLSLIAKREYQDSLLWPLIWKANEGAIGNNPNLIAPGMKLSIPSKSTLTPAELERVRQQGRGTGR